MMDLRLDVVKKVTRRRELKVVGSSIKNSYKILQSLFLNSN